MTRNPPPAASRSSYACFSPVDAVLGGLTYRYDECHDKVRVLAPAPAGPDHAGGAGGAHRQVEVAVLHCPRELTLPLAGEAGLRRWWRTAAPSTAWRQWVQRPSRALERAACGGYVWLAAGAESGRR